MNEYKENDQYKGWLYKWTNYLRGYQKRWFVVQNGLLSYYRNQAEMSHSCRGTINLTNATIETYDNCTFMISTFGNQTYHLRTYSELEMKRWVTALSLAKAKAIALQEADDDSDINVDETGSAGKCGKGGSLCEEIEEVVRTINRKLEDLSNCQPLLERHGDSLFKALNELEHIREASEAATKIRVINERAVHFRVASSAMINACTEFGTYVSDYARRWQRMLQYERDQRLRLEAMVEELAKQHCALEKKVEQTQAGSPGGASKPAGAVSNVPEDSSNHGTTGDSDDEDFYDALDEPETAFSVSLPRAQESAGPNPPKGRINEFEHDYESSEESDGEQQEIKVIAKRTRKQKSEKAAGAAEKVHKRTASTDSIGSKRQLALAGSKRKRRTAIPDRPNYSINLWSIMKNCIGKELTKIPMPVNFSEPLSMLQRLTEDFEYSLCLDKAARCSNSIEEMAYVAAFTTSSYSTTTVRTGKPFNPLLGETFECDRTDDMGWKSLAEQVSHHPPAAALHCESPEWETWQEFSMSSKFRGKYLGICPLGIAHLTFKGSKGHYTWRKVNTTVHNIIVGKLWIDNHGEMDIVNHTTGEKCHLIYKPYSYFSREVPRRVTGVIYDAKGEAKFVLNGTWDEYLEGAHVLSTKLSSGKPVFESGEPRELWRRTPAPPGSDRMYNFTRMAIELNEMEDDVAPTDCRRRPDQRKMEEGLWDEANKEKVRLEEKQRAKRRIMEKEEAEAREAGKPVKAYEPVWFKKQVDSVTGQPIHIFTRKYWDCKAAQEWSDCPDLY